VLLDEYLDACVDLGSQQPDSDLRTGIEAALSHVDATLPELDNSRLKIEKVQRALGMV
jgi:hypothetical protein